MTLISSIHSLSTAAHSCRDSYTRVRRLQISFPNADRAVTLDDSLLGGSVPSALADFLVVVAE